MVTWSKTENQLSIEQRAYSKWLYTLLGILGILLLPIGALGLLVQLVESGKESVWQIFSTTTLVFHFLTTMGIMLIYVRFSSQSNRRYYEKLIFHNETQTLTLYAHKQTMPYVIAYADIAYIHTLQEQGGPDYPDMNLAYIIKKDGAEFWIAAYGAKQKAFFELVEAIAAHTGFEVKDASNLGTAKQKIKTYPDKKMPIDYVKSNYVKQQTAAEGEVITIKAASKPFSAYLIGILAYGLFFTVPFYIIHNFTATDGPLFMRIASILFIVLWYGILIMLFLVSIKDYAITVNSQNLKIELKCKPLFFLKSVIIIPAANVRYVRTNRLDGGHFSLSLGISTGEKSITSTVMALMNISTYTKGAVKSRFFKDEKMIHLWVVPAGTQTGKGPMISDLLYIEKIIQDKLQLTEQDISY